MNKKTEQKDQATAPSSLISKITGSGLHLFPGESADDYRQGLAMTIQELSATTPLQMYLAEKIFDCVWWIRRHENQKNQLVVSKMWEILSKRLQYPPSRDSLSTGRWDDPGLLESIAAIGHTAESLLEQAMKQENALIAVQDARINDRIKALRGLQSAYESLSNRKLVIERIRLQNESLRRDLAAIDTKVISNDD